jgi:acyl carrier protein
MGMMQSEALDWVAGVFEEKQVKVGIATRREEIVAWDSLGVLTLLASMDNDFGIALSDEQIGGLKTVGDILEILRSNGTLS